MWITLDDLKSDMSVTDTRDDLVLQMHLDAAIAFVERVRPEFSYDGEGELPPVTANVKLGALRLAGRWFTRRRSPDGLISMAELGAARVPSFDADIERLLGIGRYRSPVIA